MTEQEREELIEKITERIHDMRLFFRTDAEIARAALEVAEPVIREQCARIADKTPYAFDAKNDMNTIAAAIREGGKDAADLWRHVKTGGVYEIVGECIIEATNKPAVLYRSVIPAPGRSVWARPKDEFFDGRFEKVDLREAGGKYESP
jgi:hypothetical protein